MFGMFKQKKPLEEIKPTEFLLEEIKVDSLKEYVVNGFELESQLNKKIDSQQDEIERLKVKLKENAIQAVVLSEYKGKIDRLQEAAETREAEIISQNETINSIRSKLNTVEISSRVGKTEYDRGIINGKEEAFHFLSQNIQSQKGNLSKVIVMEMINRGRAEGQS